MTKNKKFVEKRGGFVAIARGDGLFGSLVKLPVSRAAKQTCPSCIVKCKKCKECL